jgi:hypothetical protein
MQIWKSIKLLFARAEPLKVNLQQPAGWQDPAWQVNPIQQMHYFQSPELKQEDVERVARRDYPADMFGPIMGLLGSYGNKLGKREAFRMQLAILKLANGDYERIEFYIELARYDFREILSQVQYPIPHEWLYRG